MVENNKPQIKQDNLHIVNNRNLCKYCGSNKVKKWAEGDFTCVTRLTKCEDCKMIREISKHY